MMDIEKIQSFVYQAKQLHISDTSADLSKGTIPLLNMSRYSGLSEYRPEELVMTAKAGTTIKMIEQTLSASNQCLPFKTDNFTIGAAYAKGSPELRDVILGIKIIDGQGRYLCFGGQMIKNVAGYDVSRLLVGSKGLLAVICEISFKVLPITDAIPTHNSAVFKSQASSAKKQHIEQGLKDIFDPTHRFI